jgi:hypothetical protein
MWISEAGTIHRWFSGAYLVRRKENKPCRPIVVWDFAVPTCTQSAHRQRQGCQLYAPASLYFPATHFLFLVLISVTGWVKSKGLVRLEGLGKLKKFNDRIGARNLPWNSYSKGRAGGLWEEVWGREKENETVSNRRSSNELRNKVLHTIVVFTK